MMTTPKSPTLGRTMRWVLLSTAGLNAFGALLFIPACSALRDLFGLPSPTHPLYLATISSWIFAFGVAYLWMGITGRAERLILSVGAFGKASFWLLLFGSWLAGNVPWRAAVLSTPDLLYALLFVNWLYQTRGTASSKIDT